MEKRGGCARRIAGALALAAVVWAGAAQASPVWVWRNSGLVKLNGNLSLAGGWSYAGAIEPGGIVYDAERQTLWLNDRNPSGNLYRIRLASPAAIAKVPMDLPGPVAGSALALFAASVPAEASLDIETKLAASASGYRGTSASTCFHRTGR